VPEERAFIRLNSMKGMRGAVLKYYIDGELKLYANEEEAMMGIEDDGTGFGGRVGFIEFAMQPDVFKRRMMNNADYADWANEKEVGNLYADKELKIYRPTIIGKDVMAI